MRILSVTAQKPCSTGSGVYLTEVVKALAKEGHTQTVLAGIARGEQMDMPDGVKAYPVYFESEGLPYPVVGMSDEMPYISTRYKDMTEEMTVQFRNAFLAVLDDVFCILVKRFSRFRQRQSPVAAAEQLDVQAGLQRGDLFHHSRRRNEQLLRSLVKAARVRHTEKGFQLRIVHTTPSFFQIFTRSYQRSGRFAIFSVRRFGDV